MIRINKEDKDNFQIHTQMYETLYKTLMTPEMIKIRKANMERRIVLYNLNKSIIKMQERTIDHENQYIKYLKELEKENIKYSQEKIY